jgi:hypothetical protein
VNFMEEEWLHAERCVARRPSPSTPGWEVLVKWQGQVRGREGEAVCCRGLLRGRCRRKELGGASAGWALWAARRMNGMHKNDK